MEFLHLTITSKTSSMLANSKLEELRMWSCVFAMFIICKTMD